MDRCKPIFAAVFLALWHVPAHAAEPVVGANLAAMGGASAAVSTDNAPLTSNPGVISLDERYDLHGHFRYGPTAISQWGVSAVDGRTSAKLAMGLYYAGDRGSPPIDPADLPGWTVSGVDPENVQRHHNITLAFAGHGWDRRFGFGISGTMAIYSTDLQGRGSTGNVDVGIGGQPTQWLTLGLAGRNLIPVNDIGVLPMAVVAGFRFHGQSGAIIGDAEWREDARGFPLTLAGGGEVPLGAVPVLRAGYRFEAPTELHKATVGFGLVGDTGSLDIGLQVPVGANQPTVDGLSGVFSITLYAPSSEDPVGF